MQHTNSFICEPTKAPYIALFFLCKKKNWCELNTSKCLPAKQWILTCIWPNVFQWEILGPWRPEDLLKLNQPPSSDDNRRPINENGSPTGTKPVRERLFPNLSIVSTTDRCSINHPLNFNNLTTTNNIITTIPKNGGTEDKRTKDGRMIIFEWKPNCRQPYLFIF